MSLVALLVALVVLGASAAIVVATLPTTSSLTVPTSSTTPGGTGQHTTTTTSRSIPSAALVAECVADVGAVQTAAQAYRAVNGTAPPAGTAWATRASRGGPYLQSWPSAPGQFTVRWTSSTVLVTPAHGRASRGSAGTASPPSGCYAV